MAPEAYDIRSIPKPDRPPGGGCSCTARADADDTMPSNLIPGRRRFAFGSANASDCVKAASFAKRAAIDLLGMKPKHVKVRCSG